MGIGTILAVFYCLTVIYNALLKIAGLLILPLAQPTLLALALVAGGPAFYPYAAPTYCYTGTFIASLYAGFWQVLHKGRGKKNISFMPHTIAASLIRPGNTDAGWVGNLTGYANPLKGNILIGNLLSLP